MLDEIIRVVKELILPLSYIIGVIIIIKFQKQKIDALKTQVDSQSGILADVKTFMSITKLERLKDYATIVEETADKKVKAKDEEWEATIRKMLPKYREEIESKTIEKFQQEFKKIGVLLVYLFLDLRIEDYIKDKYIAKMEDGVAKRIANNSFEVAKEIVESPFLPPSPSDNKVSS